MKRSDWELIVRHYADLCRRIADRLSGRELKPGERWVTQRDLAAMRQRLEFAQQKSKEGTV